MSDSPVPSTPGVDAATGASDPTGALGLPAARPFRHDEPGTPEHRWLAHPGWDRARAVVPADLTAAPGRVVVLCAHPDDETLGVGATIADLAAAGADIDVVLATAGEASHPDSELWTPDRLARVRHAELRHALARLAPQARLHALGLPDGGLADDPEGLRRAIDDAIGDAPVGLVLAPLDGDGHPDHDAVGRAAAALARRRGAPAYGYPIWLWHWAVPDELPWDRVVAVQPSADAQHAKTEALARHVTQVGPLSPLPGDETLLGPHVLARFERVVETLLPLTGELPDPGPTPAPAREQTFDDLYGDDGDPWGEEGWYERRKLGVTLALRSRERYGSALDVGCGTGALAWALAEHCDRMTAVDGSRLAVERARRAYPDGAGDRRVRWLHGDIPGGLPDEPVDLVTVSEVAYFLTPVELLGLLRHVRRVLRPGGELILIDWQPRTQDIPLDGELVHRQARAALADLPHRVRYADEHVRIDAWGGAPGDPAAG